MGRCLGVLKLQSLSPFVFVVEWMHEGSGLEGCEGKEGRISRWVR